MVFDISQLKKIRRQLNLTQHAFAKQVGISQSMVAKIESGKLDPTYSKVQSIEKAISLMTHQNEAKAKEIMTKKIISASLSEKVDKIIDIMNKHGISQVPIIEKGYVAGLVSESSILSKNLEDVKKASAQEIMGEAPPIISEDARIEVVKQLLVYYPIVLVKKAGRLIGVITKSDVIKVIVRV